MRIAQGGKGIIKRRNQSQTLYPFNKVHHTESGHMIEMDDSVGGERLAVSHRSGTFYEIHKDGSEVHRVVNDNYTVICKDDNVYIGGKCKVKILGDANIDIEGKADIKAFFRWLFKGF